MKNIPTLILMPGMDGTGELFSPIVAEIRRVGIPFKVVSYPEDLVCEQETLVEYVRRELPTNRDYLLVAESFSGPIAVKLAASQPTGLKGVVLVASFLSCPHRFLRWTPEILLDLIFRLPPPEWALRKFLLGENASSDSIKELSTCLRKLKPSTLGARLKLIRNVDVRREFDSLKVPVTYLAGSRDALLSKTTSDSFKNARYIVVDAPHLILQRNPRAAVAAIQMAFSEQ